MKKRLQFNFFLISALGILTVLSLTTVVFYNLFQDEVMENLETCAHVLGSDVKELKSINTDTFQSDAMNHIRVTLIDTKGNVLFDSNVQADKMENHKERPEIQEAMKTGEGEAIRRSATLDKSAFYYAVKVSNGNVLRVSKESQSFFSFLIQVFPLIGGIVFVLFVICVFLSHFLARTFVRPIETLAKNMDGIEPVESYKELVPFIKTIQKQHEDIVKNSQMRQEFTANVSHELKTPLTSISGYSELIENGMVSESDTARFAGEIHKNANRLLVLINDIIQLSKLDYKDFSNEFEVIDLAKTTESCVEMLHMSAQTHDVSIHLSASGRYLIHGSAKMMEEMVYNLIDNAIRYNRVQGEVFVTLSKMDGHVCLSVRDTGIGISKEHQERIFERFYRVDKSRSKETGGTGLGLAIVKHIVGCHNAAINVKSEEGEGTEICVAFDEINE